MAVSGILRRWAPFAFAATAFAVVSPPASALDPAPAEYRFSGPYTHDNLTIFLVHGKAGLDGKAPITLQDAMLKGLVRVHETGSVNELQVENLGGDSVFIQSGDIVKGGKQDRVLSVDLILPPHSGKVAIASFCVEQSRWTSRGQEDARTFSSSGTMLPSRDMKVAARAPLMAPSADTATSVRPDPRERRRLPQQRVDNGSVGNSQGKVWRGVSAMQDKLQRTVGAPVAAPQSTSSLQLSMENEKLKQATAAYVAALDGALDKEDGAIGFVFAINGQINSADIYGAPVLFRKMWPKLLQAAVIEAVAERKDGLTWETTRPDALRRFLADAEAGKRADHRPAATTRIETRDADKVQYLEARPPTGGYVHRSYVAK